ncbi:hypothetical protein IMSAG049_01521 [Clostridiales bacterium]|nr:hypothetical protein IMSAG049_01521 [Clostridiales bacterium]
MKYVYIRLPELLSEKGISKEKMCSDLNLKITDIDQYYNNQLQSYDCDFLARVCEYLDCDISELLEIREKD